MSLPTASDIVSADGHLTLAITSDGYAPMPWSRVKYESAAAEKKVYLYPYISTDIIEKVRTTAVFRGTHVCRVLKQAFIRDGQTDR